MTSVYPKKVDFLGYEHSFSYDLLKDFEEGRLDGFDIETMRGLIYGYTFTEDYAKGIIPDALSMDYWSEAKTKNTRSNNHDIIERYSELSLSEYLGQGPLIWEAIMSTGKGTLDNPFYVICVGQEYEFMKRHCVFEPIKIIKQTLLPGNIDCIEFESNGHPQSIYFDVNRWFERIKIERITR